VITGQVALPLGVAVDAMAALSVPPGSYSVVLTLMSGGPIMIGQDADTPGPVVLWLAYNGGVLGAGMTTELSVVPPDVTLWLTSLNADGVAAAAFMMAVGRPALQI